MTWARRAAAGGFAAGCALLAVAARGADTGPARPPAAAAPAPGDAITECDRRAESRPGDYAAFHCYLDAARRERRFEEAARRLEALLALDPKNTFARVVLARVASDLDRPGAEGLFRQSAGEFAERAMPVGEVFARLDLAFFLRRRGRLAEAAGEVARARSAADASKVPLLGVSVTSEEGWLAYAHADYDAAERLFRGAEAEARAAPWTLQAPILSGLGATLWAVGRSRESYDYYLRLAEGHRHQPDPYAEADDLYNASLLADRLRHDGLLSDGEADGLHERALAAAVRAGGRRSEAALRVVRAEDPRRPLEERLEEAGRALAIARSLDDVTLVCAALRELARVRLLADPGAGASAIRLAEEALALALEGSQEMARGRIRLAEILQRTGPPEVARAESLRALDAIERIRDLQRDDLVRARFSSEWAFYYYFVSGRLLRSGGGSSSPEDLELAFRVMERLRARVLLDRLDAAGATLPAEAAAAGAAGAESGPLRGRRKEILDRVAALQSRLAGPRLSDAERRAMITALERLEADEAALREAIARVDPGFARLRRPEPPSIAEVQEALGPEEAMIAYQLSTGRADPQRGIEDFGGSWMLVITRQAARVEPLPDEDTIEEGAGLFLGLLGRRDGSEIEGAVRLYRDIIEPALRHLPAATSRLVIVPDKALFRVPLEVLRETADAEPIGARYEMALAPSAALWLRWRRSPPPEGAVLALVLADPDPGGGSPAIDREAPGLGRLPYARREARAVERAMGGNAEVLVGRAATDRVLAAADWSRYRILHIAAHAVVDEDRPERTALLMSPGGPADDGRFGISEVASLRLRGQVVALSACRSSSGLLLRGEGFVSLARAFFQAGARAVVGSLWRIRDDEAPTMVEAFYRHLGRGASVGQALRAARAEQVAAGAPAAAWAGFVLVGDGATVPAPGGIGGRDIPRLTTALAVAIALAAAAVLLLRRARR